MKKGIMLFSLLVVILTSLGAQGFNYQTVLRDGVGDIKTNESVDVKFDIIQGSEAGTIVYSEQHASAMSSAFGVLNLIIGEGTPTSGTFDAIDWGSGPYFLKVTLGTDVMGATKFNALPFAKYASTAGSVASADKAADLEIAGATSGDLLYFNGTNWSRLAKGTDTQVLTVNTGMPSWEDVAVTGSETVQMPMLGETFDGGIIVAVYPDTNVLVVKDDEIMDGDLNTVLDYATATASLPAGYRLPTHQEIGAVNAASMHLTVVWKLAATFWTSSDHATAAETKYTYVVANGLYNSGDISLFGSGAAKVLAVKKVKYIP